MDARSNERVPPSFAPHVMSPAAVDSKPRAPVGAGFERAKERIRAGNRGGLGILLMHKCSDRLEYTGRGNVVRIEKNLG